MEQGVVAMNYSRGEIYSHVFWVNAATLNASRKTSAGLTNRVREKPKGENTHCR